jgi:hypothetical protein
VIVLAALAVGLVLGRLFGRARARVDECPRCALEAKQQQLLMEISAQRRQTEAQMMQAAWAAKHYTAPWRPAPSNEKEAR